MKNSLSMKKFSINNFTTKLLSTYILNGPPYSKKFTKNFGSKVINRQYFHRKTGLKAMCKVHARYFLLFSFPLPHLLHNSLVTSI